MSDWINNLPCYYKDRDRRAMIHTLIRRVNTDNYVDNKVPISTEAFFIF